MLGLHLVLVNDMRGLQSVLSKRNRIVDTLNTLFSVVILYYFIITCSLK